MVLIKRLIPFFLLAVYIFLTGCSSSSYSQRYGREKTEEKTDSRNARFTDKDTLTDVVNSIEIFEEDDDEHDYEPNVESVPIDPTGYLEKLNREFFADTVVTSKDQMLIEIIKYMNTPYKYAGNSFDGIDCSGLTKNVFGAGADIELPRSTVDQYLQGEVIDDKDSLKFGDLVFFNTRRRSNPGHVGIYLGDKNFAHASRKLGVIVSSLDETYYKKRYVGARRVNDF